MTWPWALLLDGAVWAGWGLLLGASTRSLTLGRGWRVPAAEARFHRRVLRVRHWQGLLPEAGPLFGGPDKRRVGGRSTAALEQYAAASRKAELVHWLDLAIVPVFALWNPAWLTAAMVLYGLVANVPCIVSMRATRERIDRLLAGRRQRNTEPR